MVANKSFRYLLANVRVTFLAGLCIGSQFALASPPLPTSADIQHGQINISTQQQQMQVNQASQYGIINWNSFSIGAGHGVHFANGAGSTLNRVTGTDASNILGTLSGTGNVFLLNQNGIIIGADGQILTGGSFVGSTHNLLNADFLNGGGFNLFDSGTHGEVTNLGKISSTGGDVILSGYKVNNQGEISADAGRVGLLAGTEFEVLSDVSWGGGAFAVKIGERGNEVRNEGTIAAKIVELRANNGNIYALAGNTGGSIQATGVRNEGGKVFLTATNGLVQSSGEIIAKNGADGGEIKIEATVVENYGGKQDVSGENGGRITIKATNVISDTEMRADATHGKGGIITIEADKEILLTSAGKISADGKTQGGEVAINANGGKIILSAGISAKAQGQGGKVSILGANIATLGGEINVDGGTQGGEVNIGGGYQGGGIWQSGLELFSSVKNANSTYISETTNIQANGGRNASQTGDGGKVNIWADGTTQFAGTISARGGELGGGGGRVETSGLLGLGVSGSVDADAPNGINGTWLLDPKNITIANTTDALTEFQRVVGTTGAEPFSHNATHFGRSVDIDGNTIAISSQENGTDDSFIYVLENGQLAARLTHGTVGIGRDRGFGESVAVAGDYIGETNFIVNNNNFSVRSRFYHKGAAWQNGSTNLLNEYLYNGGYGFGFNIVGVKQGATNARFYISSRGEDDAFLGVDSGAVYQFDVTPTTLSSPTIIRPTGTVQNDQANRYFGSYIAATEDTLYVFSDAAVNTPGYQKLWVNHQGVIKEIRGISAGNRPDSLGRPKRAAADGNKLAVINTFLKVYELDFSAFTASNAFLLEQNVALTSTAFVASENSLPAPHTGLPWQSVDISGDSIIVGSPKSDIPRGQPGAAFIFREPANGWTSCNFNCQPELTLLGAGTAPTVGPNSQASSGDFGFSVAIDGNVAVIGDPLSDGVFGFNVNVLGSGEARLVTRSTTGGSWAGATTKKLVPGIANKTTAYGRSVAVDGNTYLVTDPEYSDPLYQKFAGAVYVYEDGALAALLKPESPALSVQQRRFGWDADISGTSIAVIDRISVDNRTYIFDKGTGWKSGLGSLRYSIVNSDLTVLSNSVAIDNNRWAVAYNNVLGQGASSEVRIYENSTTPSATIIGSGGLADIAIREVDIDLSGNTLVVGSYQTRVANPASSLSIFVNSANNWATAIQTDLTRGGSEALDSFAFGGSVAIDGNTIVAGFTPEENQFVSAGTSTQGAYVYERASSAAAWPTIPTARLNVPIQYFGSTVAINGDLIAIANNQTSANSTNQQIFVFQRFQGWQDGQSNLLTTLDSIDNGPLGFDLAISGNTIISSGVGGFVRTSSDLFAYQYKGPFDLSTRSTFTNNPAENLNISASSLSISLSRGTDVTLQANNDISVLNAITVNNVAGNGGNLTLQAGRSILVNASITTDNGGLVLIANDTGATAAQRDAGEGVVVLGTGVTLNTGTADLLIVGGDRFENRSGNASPFVFDATTPGRYLIYEPTPLDTGAPDLVNLGKDLDITGRSFIQFNMSFNAADPTPASLPAGSGFIYAANPVATIAVDSNTITYGDNFTSSATLSNVTVGGVAITAADFGISQASLSNIVNFSNAGAITTSPAGFVNAGIFTGGLLASAKTNITSGGLYGVGVTVGSAGDLTVNKKALSATADAKSRTYGDANSAFTITYTGFVAGENAGVLNTAATASSTAVANSDVIGGGYTITASGGADNNYQVNHNNGTLTINKRDLAVTGITAGNKVYNGLTAGTLSGTGAVSLIPGDSASLGGGLTATATFADRHVANNKGVTVAGFVLNGTDSGNYNLLQPVGLAANITPANLLVTGLTANNKVYDRTTTSILAGTAAVAVLGGDSISLNGVGTGLFTNKNAANGKTVNITGFSLGGTNAGNYTLVQPSTTANIMPATLTISGQTADSRTYDGTTVASLSGTATITPIGADVVNLGGAATATFADRHVAAGKAVSVTGYTISGTDAGNYSLTQQTGLTSNISKANLLVTGLTSINRIYDATTTATLAGTAAVSAISGDTVGLSGTATGAYVDRHVADNKSVTASGLSLTGVHAGNYTIVYPTTLISNVTPLPLTISGITINNKVYDALFTATSSGTTGIGGVLFGDTVNINQGALSYVFVDKNVGTNKLVSVNGVTLTGTEAGNYTTVAVTGITANVTPKVLSIGGVTAADRTYDTTTVAVLSGGTLNDAIAGDIVNLNILAAAGAFADKQVGTNKAVTAIGYNLMGTDAANYVVSQPAGLTATISKANLTVVTINGNKTYDGTVNATLLGASLSGVQGADTLVLDTTGVAGSFANKLAADGKALTLTGNYVVTGADISNYNFTQPTGLTADISKKLINVTGLTIADKTYDSTIVAQLTGTGTFGGLIAGDNVDINVGTLNATFSDRNVGVNKTISFTGVSLSGTDATNYTAAALTGVTATISARTLTISGVTAQDKTYDTTTVATFNTGGSLVNTIAGDSISLNTIGRSGLFTNKDVGTNKVVTASGYALSGTDATNYSLAQPAGLTATISKANLQLSGLTANNKTYDASTLAQLSGAAAFTALVGDTVTIATTGAANFDTKNVGINKAVTLSGYVLGGTDGGNYNFVMPNNLQANITKANLVVTGVIANNRVYNATTVASLAGTAAVMQLGADQITLGGAVSALFNDKLVANGKAVAVTGYTISGTDANNYNLIQPSGLTANISKADLLLSGLVANNRVYDGTTVVPLSGAPVFTTFGSDNLILNGVPSASFLNKNVAINKAVTLTGYNLGGADAANYNLLHPSNLIATISPRDLNISGIAGVNRVYDATVAAPLSGTTVLGNLVAGDNVALPLASISGQFSAKNVGINKVINLSSAPLTGADAGNYKIVLPTNLTANVTAKQLSIIGLAVNDKTYDRTTTATYSGESLAGVIAGDTVSIDGTAVTANFDTRLIGINKTVSAAGFALSGADAVNYQVSQPTGLQADITHRILNIVGIGIADKFFDGNTSATFSGGRVDNVVSGDDVNLIGIGAMAEYQDPTVGNAKFVDLTGFSIAGTDAANYQLTVAPTTTGNILPELVNIQDVLPIDDLKAVADAQTFVNSEALFPTLDIDDLIDLERLNLNLEYNRIKKAGGANATILFDLSSKIANAPKKKAPLTDHKLNKFNLSQLENESKKNTRKLERLQQASVDFKKNADKISSINLEITTNISGANTLQKILNGIRERIVLARQNIGAADAAAKIVVAAREKATLASRLGRVAEAKKYLQQVADAEKIIAQGDGNRELLKQAKKIEKDLLNSLDKTNKVIALSRKNLKLANEQKSKLATINKEKELAERMQKNLDIRVAHKKKEAKEARKAAQQAQVHAKAKDAFGDAEKTNKLAQQELTDAEKNLKQITDNYDEVVANKSDAYLKAASEASKAKEALQDANNKFDAEKKETDKLASKVEGYRRINSGKPLQQAKQELATVKAIIADWDAKISAAKEDYEKAERYSDRIDAIVEATAAVAGAGGGPGVAAVDTGRDATDEWVSDKWQVMQTLIYKKEQAMTRGGAGEGALNIRLKVADEDVKQQTKNLTAVQKVLPQIENDLLAKQSELKQATVLKDSSQAANSEASATFVSTRDTYNSLKRGKSQALSDAQTKVKQAQVKADKARKISDDAYFKAKGKVRR